MDASVQRGKRYEKEQFGTLRGEHTGVFYADPKYYIPVDREENAVEGNLLTPGETLARKLCCAG